MSKHSTKQNSSHQIAQRKREIRKDWYDEWTIVPVYMTDERFSSENHGILSWSALYPNRLQVL